MPRTEEIDTRAKMDEIRQAGFDGYVVGSDQVWRIKNDNSYRLFNAVAHPKHYSGKIECIDCIESAVAELNGFEGFLAGNVIKYVFRFKRKNGKEDLQKS